MGQFLIEFLTNLTLLDELRNLDMPEILRRIVLYEIRLLRNIYLADQSIDLVCLYPYRMFLFDVKLLDNYMVIIFFLSKNSFVVLILEQNFNIFDFQYNKLEPDISL